MMACMTVTADARVMPDGASISPTPGSVDAKRLEIHARMVQHGQGGIPALAERAERQVQRRKITLPPPSSGSPRAGIDRSGLLAIRSAAVAASADTEYFVVQSHATLRRSKAPVRGEAVMKTWLRRIRGAVGMGLMWAAGWGLAGLLAELLIGMASTLLPGLPWGWVLDPEPPLPALAIPGFFAGLFFSVVLGIAGHRRRFRELSLPLVAAWGALGGLLLTLFPLALVAVGLASLNVSPWTLIAEFGGPAILLGVVSASVSLMLARRAEGREFAEASAEMAESALTRGEAKELSGGTEPPRDWHPSASRRDRVRPDPANDPGDA